jgi:hypothetical protein
MAVMAGAMILTDIRGRAAQALAPVDSGDPDVFTDVVDAVQPPALILNYDDPWLEPLTVGACLWDCRLEVIAIASRVEPGPGVAALEALVAYTVGRLLADDYSWPPASVQAPRVFTIGGVPLLGARIVYRVKVTL